MDDPCTHFQYDIIYQQQHKSRDSYTCLSDGSIYKLIVIYPALDFVINHVKIFENYEAVKLS